MPVTYENFYGDIYYLHKKKTKKGNWSYYFSKKKTGDLVDSIPEGYEIDEKVEGTVYLVNERPQLITDEEKGIVERSVKNFSEVKYYRIYVKEGVITVYIAEDSAASLREFIGQFYDEKKFIKYLNFMPMLRFCLQDDEKRIFNVERYCFRGAIDDWIFLDYGQLKNIARKYCSYLGKDSFYDLI